MRRRTPSSPPQTYRGMDIPPRRRCARAIPRRRSLTRLEFGVMIPARAITPKRRLRCPKCGVEFDTEHPTKKYCSKKCKKSYNWHKTQKLKRKEKDAAQKAQRDALFEDQPLVAMNCLFCKELFQTRFGAQHCSIECEKEWRRMEGVVQRRNERVFHS